MSGSDQAPKHSPQAMDQVQATRSPGLSGVATSTSHTAQTWAKPLYTDPQLAAALASALRAAPSKVQRLGVGLSGGPDSAMLVVHAADYARRHGVSLYCLHVHHGLQEAAGQWRDQARDLAHKVQADWCERRVVVDFSRGDGMESAARSARYEALIEMGRSLSLDAILLAHHQDDQAETVLMRLLRGAGPDGLAAMRPAMQRQGQVFFRPWLDMPRKRISDCASHYEQVFGWKAVQDPSNVQEDYTRGAVRTRLTPHLNERWLGWQAVLARHARQSAEVAEILAEVCEQDFAALQPADDGLSFSLAAWRNLSPARQAQVLRYWLAQAGLRMPSDARLQELMRQMRGLHAMGHDRDLQLRHDGYLIRCVRGRMLLQLANALQ